MLRVSHPDFEDNDDGQAAGFAEGVRRGWSMIKHAQSFGDDMEPVVVEPPADKPAHSVLIWFPYGENGLGVRRAEEAVAATIATVSLHVAHHNHGLAQEVLPAYSFEILRDQERPDT